MSLIKGGKQKGKIIDKGILLKQSKGKETVFTPEDSIRFQLKMKTDLMVVLDDFTDPKMGKKEAYQSVKRTISLFGNRSLIDLKVEVAITKSPIPNMSITSMFFISSFYYPD